MTKDDKLIECYQQIGDLRQTLREIEQLALDMCPQQLAYRIIDRVGNALARTKPDMETRY